MTKINNSIAVQKEAGQVVYIHGPTCRYSITRKKTLGVSGCVGIHGAARIRSMEQLRYQAPGEWGKVLELDRIPEVRTLREKLQLLCRDMGRAMKWNAQLAKEWIARQQDSELYFYCDGHVRIYHGNHGLTAPLCRTRAAVPPGDDRLLYIRAYLKGHIRGSVPPLCWRWHGSANSRIASEHTEALSAIEQRS